MSKKSGVGAFVTGTHDVGVPGIVDLVKDLRPLIDNGGVTTTEPWHLVAPDFLVLDRVKAGAFAEMLVAAMNMTRGRKDRAIVARVFPFSPIATQAEASNAVREYQRQNKALVSCTGVHRNAGIVLVDKSHPKDEQHFRRLYQELGKSGADVRCMVTPMRIFTSNILREMFAVK